MYFDGIVVSSKERVLPRNFVQNTELGRVMTAFSVGSTVAGFELLCSAVARYDAEHPSLCRARWSWHKASSGLSAPAQTCLESPLWSRSHRWRVKLRSHHTKWTELDSSSEHVQTNGNVHSVRAGVHEPCDLVCCVDWCWTMRTTN